MSIHSELMESAALPSLFDVQGEQVTYTPENGTPRSIVAIVDEYAGPRSQQQQHLTQGRKITTIFYRDSTTGIAAVKRGDRLTWQGQSWANPETINGDTASLTVTWELPIVEGSGRIKQGRL